MVMAQTVTTHNFKILNRESDTHVDVVAWDFAENIYVIFHFISPEIIFILYDFSEQFLVPTFFLGFIFSDWRFPFFLIYPDIMSTFPQIPAHHLRHRLQPPGFPWSRKRKFCLLVRGRANRILAAEFGDDARKSFSYFGGHAR
jgi:hypothetical protein